MSDGQYSGWSEVEGCESLTKESRQRHAQQLPRLFHIGLQIIAAT